MSNEFWLGLALGLPLSILGNVITRPVQNYLDSRIRSRALRRAREERRYTEEAKRLTEHPQDFHAALLYSVGFIGYWTMVLILGVLALSLVILRGAQHIRESPVWLLIPAFCFLAVIHSFRSIERQAIRAMRMALVVRRVSDRESLEKAMESESKDDEG